MEKTGKKRGKSTKKWIYRKKKMVDLWKRLHCLREKGRNMLGSTAQYIRKNINKRTHPMDGTGMAPFGEKHQQIWALEKQTTSRRDKRPLVIPYLGIRRCLMKRKMTHSQVACSGISLTASDPWIEETGGHMAPRWSHRSITGHTHRKANHKQHRRAHEGSVAHPRKNNRRHSSPSYRDPSSWRLRKGMKGRKRAYKRRGNSSRSLSQEHQRRRIDQCIDFYQRKGIDLSGFSEG